MAPVELEVRIGSEKTERVSGPDNIIVVLPTPIGCAAARSETLPILDGLIKLKKVGEEHIIETKFPLDDKWELNSDQNRNVRGVGGVRAKLSREDEYFTRVGDKEMGITIKARYVNRA